MSLEEIANAIVGLIFIVLIAGILICLGAAVYFHFTETPVPPPAAATVPTAEEVQENETEHQEFRSNKSANLCFGALGCFVLGWLTGQAKLHTLGLCLIVGAFAWDYKTAAAALFVWYFIVPALVVGGIIALFKGVFK
jgi:hypothetical protein